MIITDSHHHWFREHGQFLEPAGDMPPESLDLLRRYSQSAREDLQQEITEAQYASRAACKRYDTLVEKVDEVLEGGLTDIAKLEEIKRLITEAK